MTVQEKSPENSSKVPESSSYRQIFKATSLFGGVQVFQIITGIIRTKFVAVLLGTAGVGIMGLFNSPLQLILSITGLGITFSAVRDISEAYGSRNTGAIERTVTTLRRWSWVAGLTGVAVTASLAPLLSKWTFGTRDYTWAFVWLSVTMFMQTISNGQKSVIQACRKMGDLAKASVYGSLAGLFTAVPLFYFFGMKGIVPSLIFTALTAQLLTWHFARKLKIRSVSMSWNETVTSGQKMIKLGLIITSIGIIGFLTGYLLNAFIGRTGGVDQVGLYNAGWNIIGQSTGLVFTAMTTDYFPRLSSINTDNDKIRILVNQQAEMVLLILSPISVILIAGMPLIIRILYTSAFLPVIVFANLILMGILLKGLVWSAGFIFPAKGDLKLFGIIEIVTMIFNIVTNILGYRIYGLEGLGVSFIINYLFGLFLTLYYAYKKYGFSYSKETIKSFFINSLLVSSIFVLSFIVKGSAWYITGAFIILMSAAYSFTELDKRIGLVQLIREYKVRFFSRRDHE